MKEIGELDRGLKQLGRLQRLIERRSHHRLRQRIGKGHSPEMVCRFSIAAAGGEAADAADGVAESESGSECIEGGQRGHVILAQKPYRDRESGQQPAGENSARLQSVDGENLAQVLAINVAGAPVQNDVKNLCPYDSGENQGDAEVPRVLGIDPLLGAIADADPKSEKDADGDQDAVSGHAETADLEESGEHFLIRCGRRESSQIG